MAGDTRAADDQHGAATCVTNEGYAFSLVTGKAYFTVLDAAGEARGFLRVIDESGEDYLYPSAYFVRDDCACREA